MRIRTAGVPLRLRASSPPLNTGTEERRRCVVPPSLCISVRRTAHCSRLHARERSRGPIRRRGRGPHARDGPSWIQHGGMLPESADWPRGCFPWGRGWGHCVIFFFRLLYFVRFSAALNVNLLVRLRLGFRCFGLQRDNCAGRRLEWIMNNNIMRYSK